MLTNTFKTLFVCLNGLILLSACVSQGKHDMVVQERDQLAKENLALQEELAQTQNQKGAATQDLEAAKERIDATNRVIIESYERMVETRAKAMTAEALYDKLLNQLSSEVEAQQITIEQMQSGVNLKLPEAILFDSGSAIVKSTGEAVLNKVAKQLKDIQYQTIVGGFTDNVPISERLATQFPSNWDLAAARATNVVRKLEGAGVPKQQLVVVSFGENQPIADNDTTEGRAQNRRIEIRLRPVIVE